MLRRLALVIFVFLTGCSTPHLECSPRPKGDVVYVVGSGWHAELGIPTNELNKDMRFFRVLFPGARVIMFGYGKKTFFTAPVDTWSEYVLGPVPGPAVIHAVGLTVTPPEAYPFEETVTLSLPPGGRQALLDFIWNDLTKDSHGKPQFVARSSDPDGVFYDAQSEYNLLHTCNTWTASVLSATGLQLSADNVIFADQAMSRVDDVANSQCPNFTGN